MHGHDGRNTDVSTPPWPRHSGQRQLAGAPRAKAAGREVTARGGGADMICPIVITHTGNDGAALTCMDTFGSHPIAVTCDDTGELFVKPRARQRRRQHRRRTDAGHTDAALRRWLGSSPVPDGAVAGHSG